MSRIVSNKSILWQQAILESLSWKSIDDRMIDEKYKQKFVRINLEMAKNLLVCGLMTSISVVFHSIT